MRNFPIAPRSLVIGVAVILLLANSSQGAPIFQGLGDERNQGFNQVQGISADGSAVVGNFGNPGNLGHRWTSAGGFELLTHEGTPLSGSIGGVLSDGSSLVGGNSTTPGGGFRWTDDSGIVGLGTLAGKTRTLASDVSADGSIVVGVSKDNLDFGEAVIWSEAGGLIGLGFLGTDGRSSALAVSGDGTVVVGRSGWRFSNHRAFVWDAFNGMLALDIDDLGLSNPISQANDISLDGTTIVGGVNVSFSHDQAVRWTAAGGVAALGVFPGNLGESDVLAVSGDGSATSTSPAGGILLTERTMQHLFFLRPRRNARQNSPVAYPSLRSLSFGIPETTVDLGDRELFSENGSGGLPSGTYRQTHVEGWGGSELPRAFKALP